MKLDEWVSLPLPRDAADIAGHLPTVSYNDADGFQIRIGDLRIDVFGLSLADARNQLQSTAPNVWVSVRALAQDKELKLLPFHTPYAKRKR